MTVPELEVLFEDNHLLVLSKPAGIPTMGVTDQDESLLGMAKSYLKQKYNKPGNVYLGVVSRIDALVSGVIVFARTSKAAARLNVQFREKTTRKIYETVVEGKISQSAATIENWMCKNEKKMRMQVCSENANGAKLAQLSYKLVAHLKNKSHLEIELGTGRKHQIRVQMAHLGHPIIGDRKYGSDLNFSPGIALHSRVLSIDHPVSKKRITFESLPPAAWQKLGVK